MPLRIVVADDNDAFRAATCEVLTAAGIDVVAEVSAGGPAVVAVEEHRPDVVVLDIRMPGGGPGLVAEIALRRPETRIMCLSARDDADTVLAVLAAGASGFVAKGSLAEELGACVRRCGEGMLFVIASCAGDVRRRIADLVPVPGPSS